eukprot:TRINITY_DN7454_c0_g2_i2.p1 TRINITY_DN7454_c0_g2~~TRINITY_DN7454_c0_g2_i2.p1  ORF type:complete len:234 (-),score=63.26 TRINITY_DN7454_c0_g2_i2:30-731(-)
MGSSHPTFLKIMAEPRITFAYWNVQGIGEPLIRLLKYLGLNFELKEYKHAQREEWEADKAALNFPFPNLPYLKVGDKVVCESEAIAYFLAFHAKREDLFGSTNEERIQATVIRGVLSDVTMDTAIFFLNPANHSEQAKYFEEKFSPRFAKLDAYAAGKKHIVGDNINLVDFPFHHILTLIRKVDPAFLEKFPNLVKILDNFENVPQIKAYLETDEAKNKGILPPYIDYKFKSA